MATAVVMNTKQMIVRMELGGSHQQSVTFVKAKSIHVMIVRMRMDSLDQQEDTTKQDSKNVTIVAVKSMLHQIVPISDGITPLKSVKNAGV